MTSLRQVRGQRRVGAVDHLLEDWLTIQPQLCAIAKRSSQSELHRLALGQHPARPVVPGIGRWTSRRRGNGGNEVVGLIAVVDGIRAEQIGKGGDRVGSGEVVNMHPVDALDRGGVEGQLQKDAGIGLSKLRGGERGVERRTVEGLIPDPDVVDAAGIQGGHRGTGRTGADHHSGVTGEGRQDRSLLHHHTVAVDRDLVAGRLVHHRPMVPGIIGPLRLSRDAIGPIGYEERPVPAEPGEESLPGAVLGAEPQHDLVVGGGRPVPARPELDTVGRGRRGQHRIGPGIPAKVVPLPRELEEPLGRTRGVLHHIAAGRESDDRLDRGLDRLIDDGIKPRVPGWMVLAAQGVDMCGVRDVGRRKAIVGGRAGVHLGQVLDHPVPGHGGVAVHREAAAVDDTRGSGSGRIHRQGSVGQSGPVMGNGADVVRCRVQLASIAVQIDILGRLESELGLAQDLLGPGRRRHLGAAVGTDDLQSRRGAADMEVVDRLLGMVLPGPPPQDHPPVGARRVGDGVGVGTPKELEHQRGQPARIARSRRCQGDDHLVEIRLSGEGVECVVQVDRPQKLSVPVDADARNPVRIRRTRVPVGVERDRQSVGDAFLVGQIPVVDVGPEVEAHPIGQRASTVPHPETKPGREPRDRRLGQGVDHDAAIGPRHVRGQKEQPVVPRRRTIEVDFARRLIGRGIVQLERPEGGRSDNGQEGPERQSMDPGDDGHAVHLLRSGRDKGIHRRASTRLTRCRTIRPRATRLRWARPVVTSS